MSKSQAQGGLKTCEHCMSNMSLFADVCPHCGRRAYGGLVGASRHAKKVAEANDPGISERIKTQKRDRNKTHAYCKTCHRRVYAGEVACEAGHRLSSDWEETFKTKTRVAPEQRAGGPHPNLARHKVAPSGQSPHDEWFNEVAVDLADFELIETGRNMDKQLGGAPVEGQLKLEGKNLVFLLTLFGSEEVARQDEVRLRASPKRREALAGGYTSVRTIDRAQYLAYGRGTILDETRVSDVIQIVQRHGVPQPTRPPEGPTAPVGISDTGPTPAPQPSTSPKEIFEQIAKLGELHSAGLLTDAEFETKKIELLARI